MKAHVIETRLWATERDQYVDGVPASFVRWNCSCGRLGPALPLEGTISGRMRVERRAGNGGQRHVAAMDRATKKRPSAAKGIR